MSNLNGRDVMMVRMHTGTHATGFGNIPSNVSKDSGKQLGKVILTVVEEGVLFQCGNVETVLYKGNIISIDLAPLTKPLGYVNGQPIHTEEEMKKHIKAGDFPGLSMSADKSQAV